jgi:hypothetical protein
MKLLSLSRNKFLENNKKRGEKAKYDVLSSKEIFISSILL